MQNSEHINEIIVLTLNGSIVRNNGNYAKSSEFESLFCLNVLRTRVDYFVKLKTWFPCTGYFNETLLSRKKKKKTKEISSAHGNITHERARSKWVTSRQFFFFFWWRHWKLFENQRRFIKMYSIDGYRTYTDQLVPAMFERWPDPDTNFTVNESSFYRNEMERNNCKINENIYKSNDFNEKKTKQPQQKQQQQQQQQKKQKPQPQHIGYNLPTMSSYVFIPYFGSLQQNPASASSIFWHQHAELAAHRTYLSSDAMPFIPAKSGACKSI